MLIGFRVKNFRSFGEEQTLTFEAAKTLPESKRRIHTADGDYYKLMAVYGPNAGGKSNLVRAIVAFKYLVMRSAKEYTQGDLLPAEPFMLDHQKRTEPTLFEAEFSYQGCRYNYQFSINRTKILSERLCAFPKGVRQIWFEREARADANYDWHFGRQFKGSKRLWKESTRDNALFLSTAVQLNSDQLKPVAEWIQQRLMVLPGNGIPKDVTVNMWLRGPEHQENVFNFVKKADRTITGMTLQRKKLKNGHLEEFSSEDSVSVPDDVVLELRSLHRDDLQQRVDFSFDQESTGTQKMFELAAPVLLTDQIEVTLVADELDTHLHPVLFKYLLQSINGNSQRSQLLFTTHNTTYLNDPDILGREQIWFVERHPKTQQSELYSLSDFHPLKSHEPENFEAMYLDGRYGATPDMEDVR